MASKNAGDGLGAARQFAAAEAQAQAAAGLAGGDLRAQEAGLLIAQHRQRVAGAVEHRCGHRLEVQSACLVQGRDRQLHCQFEVERCHAHSLHLPSSDTRSRV